MRLMHLISSGGWGGREMYPPVLAAGQKLRGHEVSLVAKPDTPLDEIILKFGYRQRIWRKWLYFEIVPQASFPDDRDFEFVPGILFRVETNFGKKYIGKIK